MTRTEILAWLKRKGTRRNIAGMARYGIVAKRAFGVKVGTLLAVKKKVGKDHALALGLWASGWYEARLLAAMVDDPQLVTPRQMNAWAASFENWADCDTACFHLFDRSPHAWAKARQWSASQREFVKRGGYVLMACLALHDKAAPDRRFLPFLPLLERGARDDRNFVMKGVSWALRSIARRKTLQPAVRKVAARLAASRDAAPRWVGKDVLRQI